MATMASCWSYTEYTLADHAIAGQTPRVQPQGPLVVPGNYTLELRAAGQTLRQPLTIELDPRVHASQSDLVEQLDLAQEITRGMKASYDAYLQVAALRKDLAERQKALNGDELKQAKDAAASLDKKIDAVEKGTRTAPGFGPVNRDLTRLIFSVESADIRPADTVRVGGATELRRARQRSGELAATERAGPGVVQRHADRGKVVAADSHPVAARQGWGTQHDHRMQEIVRRT